MVECHEVTGIKEVEMCTLIETLLSFSEVKSRRCRQRGVFTDPRLKFLLFKVLLLPPKVFADDFPAM